MNDMAIKHFDGKVDEFGYNDKGKLGKFDYNDEEFKLKIFNKGWGILQYIGNETDGRKIKIPDGIVSCESMFSGCKFLKQPPVIPDGVEDCSGMFSGCISLEISPVIPDSVINYESIFAGCSEEIQKAGEWNIEHRGKDYYRKKLPKKDKSYLKNRDVNMGVEIINVNKQLGE